MKTIDKLKYLILTFLLLIGLLLIFITFTKDLKEQPLAKKGVLDLTQWNFEENGTIRLDGEWEFYWNQLLTYDDFYGEGKKTDLYGYVSVPNVWNDHQVEGKNLSGKGFATYRLHVKIDNINTLKALKILTQSSAYKLMINEKTVATSGIVGTNEEDTVPEYHPEITYFDSTNEFDLIVQISNYTYARGGFWHSIELGSYQQLLEYQENQTRREMFIFGAICCMVFYHIAIYWLRRKNKSILYFIMALIGIAIRKFVTGEYFLLKIFNKLDFKTLIFIEYLTVYWISVIWLLFLYELFPKEGSKKVVYVILGIACFITIFIGIAPIYIYTKYLVWIELFVEIVSCIMLVIILKALINKRKSSLLLLIGFLVYAIIYLHDVLYYSNKIDSQPGGLMGITTFVILLIQAYILASRYSMAFDEVEHLSNRMISLNQMKDEFFANTSHELRTPLHGMISITESVLQNITGQVDKKAEENLQLVITTGRRLAILVNDILDFSKLKHGDIKLNIDEVDIHKEVEKVLNVQRYLLCNKKIVLINGVPNKTFAYGDRERIIQILYNLIGNAVKCTEQGEISIFAVQKNNKVEISIKDTGMGIPKERLDRIFESYEQGNNYLNKVNFGTGLGLSITKQLVEIQGGEIWAESEVGKGTTFTFTLPISRLKKKTTSIIEEDTLGKKGELLPSNYVETGKKNQEFTILIVDDYYVNIHALTNILSTEPYSLVVASSGTEALDIVSKNRNIDLIILDIMMPKMSGYEVCKSIRENYSLYDLPVLMLTAQKNPNAMLVGFQSGANDFLLKPFEIDELKARVKTLLELKKSVHARIQTEMAFLQAQIKPHFLYNTLNTIVFFCCTEPEKAVDLISELSNFLRSSFDFDNMNAFVPIKKEIAFVQSFLAIEQARFGDRVKCQYDIDDINFMLPSLILEPIVENAVKHGILMKREGGEVKITIRNKENNILIKVEDDGIGMNADKLAEIMDSNSKTKSVGIKNINRRLKQVYGHGIAIESEIGKGTKVYIRIPEDEVEF